VKERQEKARKGKESEAHVWNDMASEGKAWHGK